MLAATFTVPVTIGGALCGQFGWHDDGFELYIGHGTGGELFEIKTEGTYPEEYRPMTVQAKKEIADNFRPKLLTKVADISKYDVIFLGSPNWWGTITPQVSSFLETYDLSGKTVVPFITYGGGVQNTVKDMTAQCKGCKVNADG